MADNQTKCVLIFGSRVHALPSVQGFEVECKYIKENGEAVDGSYGTTFRPSYYVIVITGLEPYNTENPILEKLSKSIQRSSELVDVFGYNFVILSIDGLEYARYYVSPYGFEMDLSVKEQVRNYTLTMIGSEEPISKNRWIQLPTRPQIPITSGRRQI